MFINVFVAAILAGAPLILATVGEIITEKSGNINLGVEGTMYIGAVSGLAGAVFVEKLGAAGPMAVIMAFVFSALMGMATSAIYGLMTITLHANQNVVGLTITILGTGLGNFLGELMGQKGNGMVSITAVTKNMYKPLHIPLLSDIPVLGKLLFSYNFLVYISFAVAIIAFVVIYKTQIGLNLRAVGENPGAADAASIPVARYRYLATIIGGGCCGIAGMYMCMVTYGGVWQHDCISGYGWLAVTLVIFSTWNPLKAIFCSIIFGALMILRLYVSIPGLNTFIYDMCPYIITSVVIIIASMRKKGGETIPDGCGENYYREAR